MVPDEAASTLLAMSSGRDLNSSGISTVFLGEVDPEGDPAKLSAAEQERYSKSQLFNGVCNDVLLCLPSTMLTQFDVT
jgi:hypothetical protein